MKAATVCLLSLLASKAFSDDFYSSLFPTLSLMLNPDSALALQILWVLL